MLVLTFCPTMWYSLQTETPDAILFFKWLTCEQAPWSRPQGREKEGLPFCMFTSLETCPGKTVGRLVSSLYKVKWITSNKVPGVSKLSLAPVYSTTRNYWPLYRVNTLRLSVHDPYSCWMKIIMSQSKILGIGIHCCMQLHQNNNNYLLYIMHSWESLKHDCFRKLLADLPH